MKPRVHFGLDEFEQRQQRVREELAKRGDDGMLLFKIEDMHWLCGLDTDGFSIFHNMFIGVGGELTHVSRSADLASIRRSSICEDVRLWVDSPGNPPVNAIRDMHSHREGDSDYQCGGISQASLLVFLSELPDRLQV